MPKDASDKYEKLSQHEHILKRPDTYVGSIERTVGEEMWIFDEATGEMTRRKLSFVPALYKIFDEILVNAADNKVRDPKGQTLMKVDINPDEKRISVWNNGHGIPVQMHKQHNIWIPELIFGHLLTSSNYDDTEAKVTGGRNGYGAKLANVFSRRFELETVCSGKKFKMKWTNNMLTKSEPVISSTDDDDYTCVTFWPDLAKFGMTELEEDMVLLMKRRVYDIAGTTDKSMKVKLNNVTLPVQQFTDLVDLYPTLGEDKKNSSYVKVGDRWEVCVRLSNIGYQHVSFVNSIATTKGGNHVKYIVDQLIDKIIAAVQKKHKGVEPKPHMIRPHLFVFVKALIDNPSFSSQTKEELNTTKAKFGSECNLPEAFIASVLKNGIIERTVASATDKLTKLMESKVKLSDRSRITGIPKLEDANMAGTKESIKCTLILTEGDSAKALAVSGLSTIGRDYYGVFPLRGKPLNVRDVGMKKIAECEEIQAILKIMGLKINQAYTSAEGLRYGHILIMSDQDHDGSHIKGLIVNLIHHFWPQLLRVPGFLQHFITPIVKALPTSKGPSAPLGQSFFSLADFLTWRTALTPAEAKKYSFKYYKGLGTSTAAEGREYFSQIAKHRITFLRDGDEDEQRIVMAFSKDRVEDRKRWITAYEATTFQGFDYRVKEMRYREFIDKELILFSVADCERSIPNVIDGLKPGQRKILFSCFKRNLTKPIKVAQLAGYVSEHSAYHHGEASLTATIVNLAQDYVGANNVPLLVPDGQYGTRMQGGKDSASARYIFTNLSPVTRYIYHKADDFIVDYKDDDGFPVEPHFYVPVIPMVLVNGTSGIGTGFATSIPNFSPWEIIKNLRRMIAGQDPEPMYPWYHGYIGSIEPQPSAPGKFTSKGKLTISPDGLINVTELPIGYWTSQYKKFLEELSEKELLVTFRENHTDITVDFDIVLQPAVLEQWSAAGVLEEKLDLKGTIHTTNIIGFNEREALTKYANAEAVLKEFFLVRLSFYDKRKSYLMNELQYTIEKLSNTVRFVNEVVAGRFDVTKKKKSVLLAELRSKGYKPFPPLQKKNISKTATEAAEAEQQQQDDQDTLLAMTAEVADAPDVEAAARDYDYLLGLRIWSLTLEMVARLEAQLAAARVQLDTLKAKDPRDLWVEDLDALEGALKTYFTQREKESRDTTAKKKTKNRIDMSRVRIPVLGDKARSFLEKDSDKAKAKLPKDPNAPKARRPKRKKNSDDETGGIDSTDSDNDDDRPMVVLRKPAAKKSTAKAAAGDDGDAKPKPKPKRVMRKKKSSDSDEDSSSDTSSDDDASASDAAPKPAKRTRAENPKPKVTKAPAASKKKADASVFSLDDLDRTFGLEALQSQSSGVKTKSPAKPKPSIVDSDDDDLLGITTSVSAAAPVKKAPAPPAAKPKPKATPPKKVKKVVVSSSSSEDESSAASSGSDDDSSSEFGSEDSDDGDLDSD